MKKAGKKFLVLLVTLAMALSLLPTAFASARPGGGDSTKFNHLDIKLAGSFAYLNNKDAEKTVGITWNKSNIVKYMKVYIGTGSTTNVVPSTTTGSGWGSAGSDENRINTSGLRTDPVRVVIEIPVTALGLSNAQVSDVYDTNAQGIKVLEFETVYYWGGSENICPDKSGLDVKISSTALIDYAKYGTIEIRKTVENATSDNTSFSFRLTSADGKITQNFSLKSGQAKKFESLPVGTYYVDEINVPSGYTVKGYNREVVLKEANEYKILTVTNVKSETAKGNLTVGKTLSEAQTVNLPDTASFTFTVTGNGTNESFTLTKADLIAGRNSYTFANLAPGSYTVTESSAYSNAQMTLVTTATVKVGSGTQSSEALTNGGLSAAVQKGKTTTVWFTNTYDAKPDTYPVTVNYYKDSVTNTDDGNFLGSAAFSSEYTAGSSITLAAGTAATQLNYLRPDGYKAGVQQGSVPYTVTKQGNVINVLYVEETYGVIVNYYKDSVTNTLSSNYLGSAIFGSEYTAGSSITLADGTAATQLNYLKPDGYKAGVQQGSVPYTVTRQGNVINVLYVEETYGVIVNYYKDSVTNTDDSNFLGSAELEGTFKAGETIALISGTGAAQLNFLQPENYGFGAQQGSVPYTVTRQGNVINVLYTELEDIPDEEPPLSPPTEDPTDPPTEDIPDEEVPLTGDARTSLWGFMMAAAACGAGTIVIKKKIRG